MSSARRTFALIAAMLLTAAPGTSVAHAQDAEQPLPAAVGTAVDMGVTTPLRFDGGLYIPQTGEILLDRGGAVDVVTDDGDGMIPENTSGTVRAHIRAKGCSDGTYTHCETIKKSSGCVDTRAYLNYNPEKDKFADAWGDPLSNPDRISIRNAPYRNVGPRGVVAFYGSHWTFVSANCL